jgi:hypothetical protein
MKRSLALMAQSSLVLVASVGVGHAATTTIYDADFEGTTHNFRTTEDNSANISMVQLTDPDGGLDWRGTGSTTPRNQYEGFRRHFSANGQTSLGTIPMDQVGDQMTWQWDWVIEDNQNAQNTSVALFDVDSPIGGGSGINPPSNPAYRVVFSLNGSKDEEAAIQKTTWDDNTDPATLISTPSGWAEGATRRLEMHLQRTASSEMTITFSDVTGGSSTQLDQFVDSSSILTEFNTSTFTHLNGAFATSPEARISDINGTFTPVPEPTTLGLLGLGGVALLGRRRRS